MDQVKRLCPECGVANPLSQTSCQACGADVKANLPVPVGERLPVPWKEFGTSLAVGAGVLALRAGLRLARYFVARQLTKTARAAEQDVIPVTVQQPLRRRQTEPENSSPRSGVRVWGRRVRGSWRSDGSRQVEAEEFFWQADDSAH